MKTTRVLSEINITSLVDVTMVLLIIFIMVAPMMKHGIDVDLPEVSAKSINLGEELVVTVDGKKLVYFNERNVSLDSLEQKMRLVSERKPNTIVYLKADKNVPYGFIVAVMGKIREAGISRLAMVTEPLE